jgi:hypothetical protein
MKPRIRGKRLPMWVRPEGESVSELTEGQAAGELGVERLELYLLAAAEKIGRFDSLTHLLIFRDEEVNALAARLGVKRRRHAVLGEGQQRAIPEPTGE